MSTQAKPSNFKSHVLERILLEARSHKRSGRPFLAVFDLDSTLFDLTLRVASIVDQFACDADAQKTFPAQCSALKNIEIRSTDWGITEALERMGIIESEHAEFYKAIHSHWAKGFFSNDFLHHDEPLPGAVEFVHAILNEGADVMYLTGRDVARMQRGTEESLRNRGFPLDDSRARLILKHDVKIDDAQFKVDVLKDEARRYHKIWLFENEPVNLNLMAKECPDVGLVFIDSTHSGREQVADTLDRIKHFEVDLEELRKFHGG